MMEELEKTGDTSPSSDQIQHSVSIITPNDGSGWMVDKKRSETFVLLNLV